MMDIDMESLEQRYAEAMRTFTYQREHRDRWEGILRRDAPRAVAVLKELGREGSSSASGDIHMDVYPILKAVHEAAIDGGPLWKSLVRAGIADGLCQTFIDLKVPRDYSIDEAPSYYFMPMDVLFQTTQKWNEPYGPTEKAIASSLKRHWAGIVKRLSEEPDFVIEIEEHLCQMRAIIPRLILKLMQVDPSFEDIFLVPSDPTVTLLTRYMLLAKNTADFLSSAFLVRHLIEPDGEQLHGLFSARERSQTDMFLRIVKASNRSYSKFFSQLASRPVWDSPTEAYQGIQLLLVLWDEAFTKEIDAFFHALFETPDLWRKLLHVMDISLSSPGTDEMKPYQFVMTPLSESLRHSYHDYPNYSERLLRSYIEGDILAVLDHVLPYCVSHLEVPEIPVLMGRLFSIMYILLEKHPTLVPLLQSELPRPRIFRALTDSLDTPDGPLDPSPDRERMSGDSSTLLDDDSDGAYIRRGWISLRFVEKACYVEKQCMRRGCTKKSVARCVKCSVTYYCDKVCQKMDWKEHRLVCQFLKDEDFGLFECKHKHISRRPRPQ